MQAAPAEAVAGEAKAEADRETQASAADQSALKKTGALLAQATLSGELVEKLQPKEDMQAAPAEAVAGEAKAEADKETQANAADQSALKKTGALLAQATLSG